MQLVGAVILYSMDLTTTPIVDSLDAKELSRLPKVSRSYLRRPVLILQRCQDGDCSPDERRVRHKIIDPSGPRKRRARPLSVRPSVTNAP